MLTPGLSAPGIKFGFTGNTVAISFGNWTSDGALVGYRIGGMDWAFTNVTASGTHLFVSKDTAGVSETWPYNPLTFELRVTNWAYGVQIDQVHVAKGEKLVKIPAFNRRIEVIGDSLASGMYTSYEGLSSWAYALGAGLGDTEYSITAYPGICAADQDCWGNPRGQSHQWFYTSDTSYRASVMYGGKLSHTSNQKLPTINPSRQPRTLELLQTPRRRHSRNQHRHKRPKRRQQRLHSDLHRRPHQTNPRRPRQMAQSPGHRHVPLARLLPSRQLVLPLRLPGFREGYLRHVPVLQLPRLPRLPCHLGRDQEQDLCLGGEERAVCALF